EIPDLFRFAGLGAQSAHIARLREGAAGHPAEDSRAATRAQGAERLRRRARNMANERREHV
ncbi:MAG: hypothetical protein ACK5MQ_17810, partial [Pikeienuella sp.]